VIRGDSPQIRCIAANVLNEKLWTGTMGDPQAWVLSRFVLKLVYTGSVIPVPINLKYNSKMAQK
jgi:hypothetical protein